MKARKISADIWALGAIDWDRRLFDSLVPLPDGTSYNAYLVRGKEKVALLDTVDPSMTATLLEQLREIERVDYLISHHAEQDHSGSIPQVLQRYPQLQVVTTPKAKSLLSDHLSLPAERIITVEDGQRLDLGGRILRFLHTPWVHWPETMVSYLENERILFSCDFFGSHLATSELYEEEDRIYEPAKRYYAEIMMPFRTIIQKNLEKIAPLAIDLIAPSHGPLHRRPSFILEAYQNWVSGPPGNEVAIAYVSMHGSTRRMVDYLSSALMEKGVRVVQFDLSVVDLGKLAMALVDAGSIVFGCPTVLGGPHPLVANAAVLSNALRPKALFLGIIGSYGWGTRTVEILQGMIPNLQVETLGSVLAKGFPVEEDFYSLDHLAQNIASRHLERGLV